MNVADFAESMGGLRRNESAESAVIVEDFPELRRLCGAWLNCPRRFDYNRKELDPKNVLESLWGVVLFDPAVLARMAGIASHDFDQFFDMAKTNLLIYPDGTVSSWVTVILQRRITK